MIVYLLHDVCVIIFHVLVLECLYLVACEYVCEPKLICFANTKTKHQYRVHFHLNPINWFIQILQLWPHAIVRTLGLIINDTSWILYSPSSLPTQVMKLDIWTLYLIVFQTLCRQLQWVTISLKLLKSFVFLFLKHF